MSEQTIRLAELGIDAFNRRDVERVIEIATDDFVFVPALPAALGEGKYVGHSGIRRYFAESEGTWEELIIFCDAFRDVGDRLLILGRVAGGGSGSGVPVERLVAFIYEFRGGKISKASTFLNRGDALKAVGLSE